MPRRSLLIATPPLTCVSRVVHDLARDEAESAPCQSPIFWPTGGGGRRRPPAAAPSRACRRRSNPETRATRTSRSSPSQHRPSSPSRASSRPAVSLRRNSRSSTRSTRTTRRCRRPSRRSQAGTGYSSAICRYRRSSCRVLPPSTRPLPPAAAASAAVAAYISPVLCFLGYQNGHQRSSTSSPSSASSQSPFPSNLPTPGGDDHHGPAGLHLLGGNGDYPGPASPITDGGSLQLLSQRRGFGSAKPHFGNSSAPVGAQVFIQRRSHPIHFPVHAVLLLPFALAADDLLRRSPGPASPVPVAPFVNKPVRCRRALPTGIFLSSVPRYFAHAHASFCPPVIWLFRRRPSPPFQQNAALLSFRRAERRGLNVCSQCQRSAPHPRPALAQSEAARCT